MVRKNFEIVCQVAVLVIIGSVGVLAAGAGAPEPVRQPVFAYLQADMTDHINIDITEDRLRHLLPMLEKLRAKYPGAHTSAMIMFSGAASDALAQRNSQSHIVDFVKDYISRGIVEVGYDGADEPTYATRPVLDFSNAKTAADRWQIRTAAAENLLAEGRDPVTGAIVAGKDGGLKRLQQVFGPVVYVAGLEPVLNIGPTVPGSPQVTGVKASIPKLPVPLIIPEVGADSETVVEVHRYNSNVVMSGLLEDNPAMIPGFGGGEDGFMKVVSPATDTSPEVYWQDNVLRLSEVSNTSEEAEEAQHDYEGLTPKEVKEDFSGVNRSRVQVVRVDLADERYYLRHTLTKDDDYALKYAYDHPASPALPADSRVGAADVDAAYAKEAEALDWLASEFFPANAGSRFVSTANLRAMTLPSTGFSVSTQGLHAAIADVLAKWGIDTFPPSFVEVDGHYLSLAETFQVLTDALAELDRTGKLPESVKVVALWGPEHTPTGHGPNIGEVTAASVAHAAAGIAGRLHDTSGTDMPKNSIPMAVAVGDTNVNSAQFLRLMAAALVAPSPDTKLRIRMTYMHPTQASLMPKTRIVTEMGASWTVKPAQLQLGTASQAVQK